MGGGASTVANAIFEPVAAVLQIDAIFEPVAAVFEAVAAVLQIDAIFEPVAAVLQIAGAETFPGIIPCPQGEETRTQHAAEEFEMAKKFNMDDQEERLKHAESPEIDDKFWNLFVKQKLEPVKILENCDRSWSANGWTWSQKFFESKPIEGRVVAIGISCSWQDHGWGHRGGGATLAAFHGDLQVHNIRMFENPNENGWIHMKMFLDAESLFVSVMKPSDRLVAFANVGGSGSKLHIKNLNITVHLDKDMRTVPSASGKAVSEISPAHVEELQNAFPWQGYIERTERRGITYLQLRRLVDFVSSRSHGWRDTAENSLTFGMELTLSILNLYHMNKWVLKPATKEKNCAFVELLSKKDQVPDWFVSHWWGELLLDFLLCIRTQMKLRNLSLLSTYWVCAYANRQHDLKADLSDDPRQTSFYRAIELAKGVLLILDDKACINGQTTGPATPFVRAWCCFEESIVSEFQQASEEHFIFDIGAVNGPRAYFLVDGQCDADEKLADAATYPAGFWKARRESLFPLEVIKAGLKVDIASSKASMETDRKHILNSIAKRGLDDEPLTRHDKYEQINSFLRGFFGAAVLRQAVDRGLVEELQLMNIMKEDTTRTRLQLEFAGSKQLTSLKGVSQVLTCMSKLEVLSLNIEKTTITGEDLETAAAAMAKLKLKSLELNVGPDTKEKIKVENLKPLFGMLLTTLTKLHLKFKWCGLQGLRQLGAWLGRLAAGKLEDFSLEVFESVYYDETFKGIADGLAAHKESKLKKLALVVVRTDAPEFNLISTSLGKLLQLEDLAIELPIDLDIWPHVNIKGMGAEICKLTGLKRLICHVVGAWDGINVADLKNLQNLDFGMLDPSNKSLNGLNSSQPKLRKLVLQFYVPFNPKEVANMLTNNPNLESLSLTITKTAQNPELAPIFKGLSASKNLENLVLFQWDPGLNCKAATKVPLDILASSLTFSKLKSLQISVPCRYRACHSEVSGLMQFSKALASAQLQSLIIDLSGSEGVKPEDLLPLLTCQTNGLKLNLLSCTGIPMTLQQNFASQTSLAAALKEHEVW